jgi:hypothetical protein
MKIIIEFETDNAAFEDDFAAEVRAVLVQAKHKIFAQMGRPNGCKCTAPEAVDKLLDVNGNTVGSVSIQREMGGGFERTPDGHINNCALANGELESACQICKGTCPDRGKYPKENFMLRLKGEEKSFHCDNREGPLRGICGCNVFHKDEKGRYVCNACEAIYTGES